MRSDNTLLLIGHKTSTVRRAKAFGLNVILLQHKSKLEPEQVELADVTFVVDYTDWDVVRPLVEVAYRTWGFRAALSLTEPGLDIAARVNDLLKLGGTGFEVSHRLRDKWVMRRHLAQVEGLGLAADLVSDRASLGCFGADHGYPFIVKPTDMTAGYGLLPVGEAGDLDRVWSEIRRLREEGVTYGTTLFTIQQFIMEEYVSGPEFSIEAFSFEGRHSIVAVTEKMVDDGHFVELGHTLPARIDAALEREIVETVTCFLDVIGLADGPSHTEVRVGARGPVVIESHNRIGGDRIGDLVRAAYGIDLADYAVAWPFRLVEELPDRPVPLAGACVRFLHSRPGRIERLGGVDELQAHPDVIASELTAKVGDVVRPLHNNWDRLGLVAVRGCDSDVAVATCNDLLASLDIETVDDARELAGIEVA